MVYIDGVKYACARCIRGHRVTSCSHTDQPLQMIKPKGRPATQCSHCRESRRVKLLHTKCKCSNAATGKHSSNCPCATDKDMCTCAKNKSVPRRTASNPPPASRSTLPPISTNLPMSSGPSSASSSTSSLSMPPNNNLNIGHGISTPSVFRSASSTSLASSVGRRQQARNSAVYHSTGRSPMHSASSAGVHGFGSPSSDTFLHHHPLHYNNNVHQASPHQLHIQAHQQAAQPFDIKPSPSSRAEMLDMVENTGESGIKAEGDLLNSLDHLPISASTPSSLGSYIPLSSYNTLTPQDAKYMNRYSGSNYSVTSVSTGNSHHYYSGNQNDIGLNAGTTSDEYSSDVDPNRYSNGNGVGLGNKNGSGKQNKVMDLELLDSLRNKSLNGLSNHNVGQVVLGNEDHSSMDDFTLLSPDDNYEVLANGSAPGLLDRLDDKSSSDHSEPGDHQTFFSFDPIPIQEPRGNGTLTPTSSSVYSDGFNRHDTNQTIVGGNGDTFMADSGLGAAAGHEQSRSNRPYVLDDETNFTKDSLNYPLYPILTQNRPPHVRTDDDFAALANNRLSSKDRNNSNSSNSNSSNNFLAGPLIDSAPSQRSIPSSVYRGSSQGPSYSNFRTDLALGSSSVGDMGYTVDSPVPLTASSSSLSLFQQGQPPIPQDVSDDLKWADAPMGYSNSSQDIFGTPETEFNHFSLEF